MNVYDIKDIPEHLKKYFREVPQLGLEKTPEEYVQKMVEVFREVRRVLRDDGTLWLNLGDSYAADRTYQVHNTRGASEHTYSKGSSVPDGLKPKDLVGIPWRTAFALQADGWYLRSDIIWAKPNPMPESVTDRPTKSHEYIFLLTKSSRYYYDAEAIKEDVETKNWTPASGQNHYGPSSGDPKWRMKTRGGGGQLGSPNGRNKRSVWTITTKPYSEAHFATFPPELPDLCIKAGTKQGDVVLDPFLGSGTVAEVARLNNRIGLGFELNPKYEPLIIDRSMAEIGKLDSWFAPEGSGEMRT